MRRLHLIRITNCKLKSACLHFTNKKSGNKMDEDGIVRRMRFTSVNAIIHEKLIFSI